MTCTKMRAVARRTILAGILSNACLGMTLAGSPTVGVDIPPSGDIPQPASPVAARPQPCAKPADLFDIDEYNGPLHQLVARFSQQLEIKTVHPSRRNTGALPCSLNARGKFHLFVEDTFEPVNFVDAAWNAGWAQMDDSDAAYGQGGAGYGKRLGAALAGNVSGEFFNTFLYPALFRQDPRYYRLAHGTTGARMLHAVRHVFVARSDAGRLMFNFSEWLGTASSTALGNVYHPGNKRGFGPAVQRGGLGISTDMGYDVLREFWPEIAHKFRLPFKTRDYIGGPPPPAKPNTSLKSDF